MSRARWRVSVFVLAVGVAALLSGAATGRTAATGVVGFDDLAAGSVVGSQYIGVGGVGAGVVLGSGPGGSASGAPPRVVEVASGAHSGSKVLSISECPSTEFAPYGIWGTFPGGGKKFVQLYIGAPSGSPTREVALVGVDSSGQEIPGVRQAKSISGTGDYGTRLEISDAQGRIAFFKIVLPGQLASPAVTACNSTPAHRIDDLSFDVPDPPPPGQPPPPPPAPDFGLSLRPLIFPLSVQRGAASLPALVDVTRFASSHGPLGISFTGLPAGVTAVVTLDSVSSPKLIKVRVGASKTAKAVVNGTFTMTATPSPTSGQAPRSVQIPFTVVENYDLAITGIDVTQGVQRDAPLPARPADGSAATYNGVTLVRAKKTVARVFAVVAAPSTAKVSGATILLHGRTKTGTPLPGSPLAQGFGTNVTLQQGFAQQTTAQLLKSGNGAVTFPLPPEWTKAGTIELEAQLQAPQVIGSSNSECGDPVCLANNRYRLRGVSFLNTGYLNLAALRLKVAGQPFPGFPGEMLSAVQQLFPIADGGIQRADDWRAEIDVTRWMTAPTNAAAFSGLCPSAHLPEAWCQAAPDANKILLGYANGFESGEEGCDDEYAEDRHNYCFDSVLGLVDDNQPAGLNGIAGISEGGRTIGGKGSEAIANMRRPLTSVAHELLHGFGADHASGGCGGDDDGEKADPWPDAVGSMLGIGHDVRNGKLVFSTPGATWYDFMSYCANTSTAKWFPWQTSDAWISPINWEFAITSLRGLLLTRSTSSTVTLAAPQPVLSVRGFVDRGVVVLTRIESKRGTPSPASESPYRLVLRDRAGATIADVPMIVRTSEGHGAAATFLAADVPLAGVKPGELPARLGAADVVTGGAIVGSAARSPSNPSVELQGPKQGARVGDTKSTTIRWTARDKDGTPLLATLEYSADDGRTWRTLWSGPNRGTIDVPSRLLTGSKNARLRVRANDGFATATSVSKRFVAVGRPPTVRVTSPANNTRIRAGERLSLAAVAHNDALRPVPQQRITWFDGNRRIGAGTAFSTGGLKPGTHRIRVEARDTRGRTGKATVRVRVLTTAPRLILHSAPKKLGPHTRRIKLRLSTTLQATATISGKGVLTRRIRGQLGPKPRSVTITIRPGTAPLRVVVRARAYSRSSTIVLTFERT